MNNYKVWAKSGTIHYVTAANEQDAIRSIMQIDVSGIDYCVLDDAKLTLRDQFAMAALPVFINMVRRPYIDDTELGFKKYRQHACESAYEYADTMLSVRNEKIS